MDPRFDAKYAASDSNGRFQARPAILNFVCDQGWHLLQVFGIPKEPEYVFVKYGNDVVKEQ